MTPTDKPLETNKVTPLETDQAVLADATRPALSPWLKIRSGLLAAWPHLRVHLLVIFLYSLIMVVFTWPLVLHLREESLRGYDYVMVGVPFDRDQFIWDIWWVKK